MNVPQPQKGTLRQQLIKCGNKRCKKCKDGPAHGPYWYLFYYQDGVLKSKYVGKKLI